MKSKLNKQKLTLFIIFGIIIVILLAWTLIYTFSSTTEDSSWDGVIAKEFTSGTGTKENPYVISSAGEFAYFKSLLEGADAALYADKIYQIKSSFNYGEYDLTINNTIPFAGTIDGNGNTISNAKITDAIFNEIDKATIKNIDFDNLKVTVSKNTGVLANSISNSNISSLILSGNITPNQNIVENTKIAGLSYESISSTIKNLVVNFDVDSSLMYVSITVLPSDSSFENVLVRENYDYIYENKDVDLSKVYEFTITNNEITVDDKILDNFGDETRKIVVLDNTFVFEEIDKEKSSNKTSKKSKSAAISLHSSGVDGDSIYINDLTSDTNYYTGLNYTEITNTNGTIPTGNNQNLYTNSNLATVYIKYSGADINDDSIVGKVSVSENVSNYYYYKKYPVVNGYITFDLIDNPWASRPSGRAFNGWVTDYDNAVISLDTDTYVRSVKIPVSSIESPISITFYTSWTIASVATNTGEISTKLKSAEMHEVFADYGDLTIYYITDHIDRYDDYPNEVIYTTGGTRIRDSYCNTRGGCDFIRQNTSNEYDSSASYYTVTPNGNNATVTRAYPTQVGAFSYYDNSGYAAGYFIQVTSGTENIYSSTGEKLTSCGSSCYKLLQYSDGTIDNSTTYYYLTTRDTNIFAPTTTNTLYTSDISTSRPMTITGINNGTDNSSNRTINLDENWEISADLRVEFVTFYVSTTTTNVSNFNSGTRYYKIIGDFNNLKLGRGLKRNGNNLTATSFVGGNSSSATSLEKYTLIVESGFYQNGSGVGYSSAVTHRVLSNVTLGSDYDRITNNNDDLIIYYCYAGSWASNLYNSSSSSDTYDIPAINTIVKSGEFGYNHADYAAGIYVGGRGSGTHYALRSVLVEGGNIYNLIGGPVSSDDRAGKNDVIINVKGGTTNMVFGGAGVSNTVGSRILNITGGTINYSILGGSNAYSTGNNSSDPYGKIDGDTLLYVGGNVLVGTQSDTLYNISSGDVFGAGNGRSGELDVGSVNNSNVIIGPSATITGNVYGGGNFGAVGGNTSGNSAASSTTTSGVYEDATSDNSIRYYGANPDNYIQFDGEIYRIVGLFNNINTANGSKNLIRIVKNTSLGNRAWGDTNMTTVETNTSTETSGNWTTSTYNYTNYYKNYYNYYVKNDNSTSNMYNYLNTTYYNDLNNTFKNYIEEVNWGLGATAGINQTASEFYTAERGSGVVNYLTGINQTANGNSSYSASFKVGLFYPSDYGFANNDSTCLSSNLGSYSSNCRTNNWMSGMTNAWTITPSTNVTNVTRNYQVSRTGNGWSGYTYTMRRYYHVSNRNFATGTGGLELKDIYYTNNDNDANNYYNTGAVYPSFYLKDDVTIVSGTGTQSDPYIIGSSEDKLTDIVYELMHPSTSDPGEIEIIYHEESEYQAKTHIQISGGSILGSVYGAGNSNGAGNLTNGKIALSKITIDMNGGSVTKSIYGGSNTKGTVYGDVFINAINGNIGESIYGGGKGGYTSSSDEGTYVANNVDVKVGSENTNSLTIHGNVYGGSAFGTVNAIDQTTDTSEYGTFVTVNNGVINGSIFGGGQGDTTYTPRVVGPIKVTINGGDMTNVFGGNDQAGSHTVLNEVYLKGGTVNSVYGGGNKSSVTNTHVYEQGAIVTNLYGGSNTSGSVTTTTVAVSSGTVGNVYGGNNEGGSCGTTNVTIAGSATISSAVYGGGNQVDTATTNITLTSSSGIIPNVYGGGNNASVTSSNIIQEGTNVTNIFGGSNSDGSVASSSITCTSGTTTNIYGGNNAGGNTIVSNIKFNGGLATNIYGGGNQATSGTSNISVSSGTSTNIYGGGNNAGLTTSSVNVTGGSISGNVYGGSNNSGSVTTTNVTVNSSSGTINAIFGGGNNAEVGNTNVIVDNGRIGNIYGGGNLAEVTGNTKVDLNGGTITTNIYGGGNYGVVKGSSTVTITDTTILGSAYAGGNGESATLEGNTNITIDGTTTIGTQSGSIPATGSVFGGGNKAATGTSNNNSTSTVNIVGGTFFGNIYGGANTSVINGNTTVNIGFDVVDIDTLDKKDIHIKGHVFGGGEANASGSETYDWDFISVTKGTEINIDANGYTNFYIGGSFYGGGNASSASGDSYLNIDNYGTALNPKRNVSIQRVKYVTLDNSGVLLKGAVDRANDYDTELFSISRVEVFNLTNNSTIYLETGANLLEEFNSLDSSGNIAAVTIDTENNTVTKTVDNRVYMIEGNNKNLNIATNQQVTEYGNVNGMSFFGLFNYDNDNNINTGIYNPTYAAGATLDWTETFTKGSYVLGAHKSNHNIEVDGFYSNYMNEDTLINEVKYIEPTPASGKFYMWFIGENVAEYNVDLVASKYSTLGSVEFSFLDFSDPNTSFQILSFDSSEMTNGVSLVDKNNIARIADNQSDANNIFGLSMEASNTGWLTTGKTSFYTSEPSISGTTYYEGENSNVVPTMLFYLYHSKNISETKELGTARISVMAITKINALSNKIERLVINVNMSTALFQTTEYEGAMTPGDKYELFVSTSTNLTNKSKFSAYYSLYGSGTNLYTTGYHRALASSYVLPENTKITMLEFIDGVPTYYYYTITSADVAAATTEYASEGECSYNLSLFTKMGSKDTSNNYNDATQNSIYYDGTDSNEEFIFIIDLSETEIENNQIGNTLLMEIRDSQDETIISVLGIEQAQMTYNIYADSDSVIDVSATASDNPLYIGYNDIFDVTVNYQNLAVSGMSITDTQYFDSKLGLQIYLLDNEDNLVSGTDLTGSYFLMDGKKYYPDIDGITHIKLSDKVGNAEKWITFNTENASIATGDYTVVFEAFGSPDGIYYSSGEPDYYNLDLTIINSSYGLKPELNQDSVIFSKNNNKTLKATINYTSMLDNPNIRLAMYRRKYDEIYDTDYELVDLQDYVNQALFGTNNTNEYLIINNPNATNELTLMLKSELETGTYRLSFRLYDDNTMIGEVVRYIIVK